MLTRRPFLMGAARAMGLLAGAAVGVPSLALPAAALRFPRDHGAHPDFRTEWWYVTGYANTALGEAAYGFQVTFFRSRIAATQGMRSTLAARHLMFAHAAVTDVAGKKLLHDQRIARWSGAPPGHNPADMASASATDMHVVLRDWSLSSTGKDDGGITARIQSDHFALNLRFTESQPVLLQGDKGLSRKGPDAVQASYYYSRPQLKALGTIAVRGRTIELLGASTGWLDHEWSEELMHPQAVGWDWIGINMLDGSALTAFRLRDAQRLALWDGGSFRPVRGGVQAFSRGEVKFMPVRHWKSPASGAEYPVEWNVQTPSGYFNVKAVLDNQELDSRASTGAIYWEGLCEVRGAHGQLAGRGYLEMTGYAAALKLA